MVMIKDISMFTPVSEDEMYGIAGGAALYNALFDIAVKLAPVAEQVSKNAKPGALTSALVPIAKAITNAPGSFTNGKRVGNW